MHSHLTEVFARLDRARSTLRAAVDTIPDSLRQQRPSPDRWSAAEVLEHLSIVERLFTGRIANALQGARASGLGSEGASRVPLPDPIEARVADRVNKRKAPDTALPTGTVNAQTAWQAIEAGHNGLRTLLSSADGLALSDVTVDHPFFGALTVYQWVELIAAHEGRHTEQIKEIAADVAKE
jgi:hypothetical protein